MQPTSLYCAHRDSPGHLGQLVALLLLLSLAGDAVAAERYLPGRVLHVADGDSLVLEVQGGTYRVELDAIDAPELNQPWGAEAADRLHRSVTGRFVVVQLQRPTTNGLVGGRLLLGDRDIGLDLVRQGLAWCSPDPAREATGQEPWYLAAQDAARAQRLGLWSDAAPVPPWEWRRTGAGPER